MASYTAPSNTTPMRQLGYQFHGRQAATSLTGMSSIGPYRSANGVSVQLLCDIRVSWLCDNLKLEGLV